MNTKRCELISIVVAVYNVENYLTRCIESLTNQTYRNLEILLVDDGSTDGSGAMCDRYSQRDERIKVVHKENGGVSSAKNKGIDLAQGEYIIFVDSDDWIELNTIELLYTSCCDNDAQIACCGRYNVYSDVKKIGLCPEKRCVLTPEEMILKLFKTKECDVSFADKLVKRSLFGELRFPLNEIHEEEDIIYSIVSKASKICLVDKPLYNYFYRKASLSRTTFSERRLVLVKRLEKLKIFMKEKYPQLEKETNTYIENKLFAMAVSIYLSERSTRKRFSKVYKNTIKILKQNKEFLSKENQQKLLLINVGVYRILRFIVKKIKHKE